MKKLAILVGAIALTGSTFAQKATAETPFSLEGQIGLNSSTLAFNAPAIRFRYFVKENIAARVTLGINKSSETKNYFLDEIANSGGSGTEVNKIGGWAASIGGEYHFTGTDRLSPYGGLDIVFGGGKTTNEWTNFDGVGYSADHKRSIEAKTSTFGVNLVAGTDYYFAQDFYLGLELGLGFQSIKTKEGSDATTIGGVTVDTKSNEEKGSQMGNNFIGNFRLGWRF